MSKHKKGKIARKAIKEYSPTAKHTRSKEEKGKEAVLQAPLWQAVSSQGPIYVKVPYSVIESEQWKTTVRKYKENPENVAKLERAINTQNPDWAHLNSVFDILFYPTER